MSNGIETDNIGRDGPYIHLILVETALELIPKRFHQIRTIQKLRARFGKAADLLDTTYHHQFMEELPNFHKRGRPDILHHFLLDTLGSPLNDEGILKIYFSNASGIYGVSKEMKCPRDYMRFKGLMAQLLKIGHVPPNPPYLIERLENNFFDWFEKQHFAENRIFKLSSDGEPIKIRDLAALILETFVGKEPAGNLNGLNGKSRPDPVIMIGGFQKGNFSEKTQRLRGRTYKIGKKGYDSWIVVQRLLSSIEMELGMI